MRLKLLAFSMVLLALPWLGWRYLDEMQGFLLEGQRQAQLLNARALATVMSAHAREFSVGPGEAAADEPGSDDDEANKLVRYARPLAEFPLLDGHAGDWQGLAAKLEDVEDSEPPLSWAAATWEEELYLLIRVGDPSRVYRHPSFSRLDTSDHLRLRLLDEHGAARQLSLSSDGPGEAGVEEVGLDWRYPLYGAGPLPVQAYWQEVGGGYQVELRLPLSWGRSVAIGAVDVQDPEERIVERQVWIPQRRPGEDPGAYRLVARSPRLQTILARDWELAEVVMVVDRDGWVRAASQGAGDIDRLPATDPVDGALAGRPGVVLRNAGHGGETTGGDSLVAAYPIRDEGSLLGAVVLHQGLDEIRAAQWQTFQGITLATLGVLVVVVFGLLLFATRIAWRIRSLGNETARAIDAEGRVTATAIRAEAHAADEFGELSRRIAAMLQRLQRYTGFLESVPRTLRHEINNPLNTISTSLQNLADVHPQLRDERYLQAAGRGVTRLERIVNSLTEAAGLEQSLRMESAEPFDLAALTRAYTRSLAEADSGRRIVYAGPDRGLLLCGSDFRIEQLLDKLVDNALDFTPEGGIITLSLEALKKSCLLRVDNDGPLLPPALCGRLFDSMVSVRDRHDGRQPHLGMGLFIARAIAEHHGGELLAANRADGSGVVMSVRLPYSLATR